MCVRSGNPNIMLIALQNTGSSHSYNIAINLLPTISDSPLCVCSLGHTPIHTDFPSIYMVVNSSVTPHNRLSRYIERGQRHYIMCIDRKSGKIKRQRIEGGANIYCENVCANKLSYWTKAYSLFPLQNPLYTPAIDVSLRIKGFGYKLNWFFSIMAECRAWLKLKTTQNRKQNSDWGH